MGESTAIGWTDHTFNPWWGCARVSPGCQHCYAEAFAKRTGNDVWGTSPRRFFGEKHWNEPRRWNDAAARAGRPALVFCASMADVFEDRPELIDERARLFDLIECTPWLRWQLLTKRPENVLDMVPGHWLAAFPRVVLGFGQTSLPELENAPGPWPPNCWIGTTVEDQQRAEQRIPALLQIPAPVRFLSCEPLLEPIDLSRWLGLEWMDALRPPGAQVSFRGEGGWGMDLGEYMRRLECGDRPTLPIGWVIVGGESGPGHRPLDWATAADVCAQVLAAEVPLFFKQWGGRTPTAGGDEISIYSDSAPRTIKQFPAEAGRS